MSCPAARLACSQPPSPSRCSQPSLCQPLAQQPVGPDPKAYQAAVEKAVAYLQTAQAADGSFSKQNGPAITALVASGLLRLGRTPSDPIVAKSLKFIEGFVQPTGGIHAPSRASPTTRRA